MIGSYASLSHPFKASGDKRAVFAEAAVTVANTFAKIVKISQPLIKTHAAKPLIRQK